MNRSRIRHFSVLALRRPFICNLVGKMHHGARPNQLNVTSRLRQRPDSFKKPFLITRPSSLEGGTSSLKICSARRCPLRFASVWKKQFSKKWMSYCSLSCLVPYLQCACIVPNRYSLASMSVEIPQTLHLRSTMISTSTTPIIFIAKTSMDCCCLRKGCCQRFI